ncbi:hypothetical protein [Microcoleus sp. D2_18a_B4]|uniref:hypothetical protein n=1 Tax=Microcoleus sp. D2_18a_B4 TaxID=3055329 RepID=UPI002FD44272
MSNSTQKREVLVALDAEFADKIDQLTDDWTEAIEQALRLWYAKQIEDTADSRFVKCRDTAVPCPYGELTIGGCTS